MTDFLASRCFGLWKARAKKPPIIICSISHTVGDMANGLFVLPHCRSFLFRYGGTSGTTAGEMAQLSTTETDPCFFLIQSHVALSEEMHYLLTHLEGNSIHERVLVFSKAQYLSKM